jgi:predicted nuclease with TOPRIM domain
MLSLDQVRLLENRVEKAVGKITSLTDENTRLRSQLSGLQTRVNELEGLVRSFKDDQGRIEEGILSALDRLSAFEDSVFHSESTVSPVSEESHDTILSETNIPVEDIVDNSITVSIPESANDQDSSASIEIEAEWQSAPAKPSTDGQMDIF